jgi:hypothetical protein
MKQEGEITKNYSRYRTLLAVADTTNARRLLLCGSAGNRKKSGHLGSYLVVLLTKIYPKKYYFYLATKWLPACYKKNLDFI